MKTTRKEVMFIFTIIAIIIAINGTLYLIKSEVKSLKSNFDEMNKHVIQMESNDDFKSPLRDTAILSVAAGTSKAEVDNIIRIIGGKCIGTLPSMNAYIIKVHNLDEDKILKIKEMFSGNEKVLDIGMYYPAD